MVQSGRWPADAVAGHLGEHVRAELGRNVARSRAVESHHEAITAHDGWLVAQHDGFGGDRAPHDPGDIQLNAECGPGRRRLRGRLLDEFATGDAEEHRCGEELDDGRSHGGGQTHTDSSSPDLGGP